MLQVAVDANFVYLGHAVIKSNHSTRCEEISSPGVFASISVTILCWLVILDSSFFIVTRNDNSVAVVVGRDEPEKKRGRPLLIKK